MPRPDRFRISIRTRFIILIVLIMVAIFAVITYILVDRNTSTLRENLENESRAF